MHALDLERNYEFHIETSANDKDNQNGHAVSISYPARFYNDNSYASILEMVQL